MKVWKVFFLFTRVILRVHVSFPGGTMNFQKLNFVNSFFDLPKRIFGPSKGGKLETLGFEPGTLGNLREW